MKIRHKHNRGLAEVSDDYGKRLVDSGLWEAEGAAPVQPPKAAKKVAQRTAQAPKTK